MARNRIAAAVALGLATLAVPCAAGSPDRYAALVYDILLLRQCGLADEAVETGFRLAVHDLIGTGDTGPDAFAAARAAGAARYEIEVRNRGSGRSPLPARGSRRRWPLPRRHRQRIAGPARRG